MDTATSKASNPRPSMLRLPRLLLRVAVCVLTVMILAGYGDSVHPMLDLFSNFQLQYFVAGLALAACLWLLRSRRWSVMAGMCAVAPAVALAPWYLPRSLPADVALRPTLRVMQFNILEGNTQYAAVAAEVLRHDVDVVAFQEVDRRWREGLEQLADALPHVVFQPAGSLRGNLIRSRHPLSEVHFEPSLGEEAAPSVSMTVLVDDQPVSMLVVHTVPPHDTHFSDVRNREMLRLAQRARELPEPMILIGDLNTGMWSPHYRAFERKSGLISARRGFGVVNTFPMDGYAVLRVPLDHCLVSPDIAVVKFQRGRPCGSDHAPIIAELALPMKAE